MTNYSFDEIQLQQINQELALEYPVHKRVWESFKKLFPDSAKHIENPCYNESDYDHNNKYLDVKKWYNEKYGTDLTNSIGCKPFILRNNLAFLRVNTEGMISGKILGINSYSKNIQDLINDIDGVEKSILENLTDEEKEIIRKEFSLSVGLFENLESLENKIDGFSTSSIIHLLEAGIFDINVSLSAFKNPFYKDAQPVMFTSHQASEKFLKALLLKCGYNDECIKNLGHNLKKIKKILLKIDRDELWDFDTYRNPVVLKSIDNIHQHVPNMTEIRYKNSGKTIVDAVSCIDSMIAICNYVCKKFLESENDS